MIRFIKTSSSYTLGCQIWSGPKSSSNSLGHLYALACNARPYDSMIIETKVFYVFQHVNTMYINHLIGFFFGRVISEIFYLFIFLLTFPRVNYYYLLCFFVVSILLCQISLHGFWIFICIYSFTLQEDLWLWLCINGS